MSVYATLYVVWHYMADVVRNVLNKGDLKISKQESVDDRGLTVYPTEIIFLPCIHLKTNSQVILTNE